MRGALARNTHFERGALMNLDRFGRTLALVLLPVVGIAVYFAPRPDPAQTDAAPSALPDPAGIGIPPSEASPLGKALNERGEAALAPSGALPGAPAPPPPRPRSADVPSKTAQVARDLPLAQAEDAPHPSSPRVRKPSVALGPCGGVTVRGITDSPDPDWAFAMLAPMPTERAKISRAGDAIGSYRVQSIEWDRVWLRGAGGRCAVRLAEGAREAAEAVGDEPALVDPGLTGASEPWRLSREMSNAIEVVGVTVRVEAGVVDALFERGAQWISGVKVIPKRETERAVGVVFDGVQEGSLLHHVGIRSGDLLRTLDSTPAESLARIGEALLAARKEKRVLLELQRDGARVKILVELV
jgi:type II secretory pathway component PulC